MRVIKCSLATLLVAGLAAVMVTVPASARPAKTHVWDTWSKYHQGVKAREDLYNFNRHIPWQFKRSRAHKHVKRQVRVQAHYHWYATGKSGNWRKTHWKRIRPGQKLTFAGPTKVKCNSSTTAFLIEYGQVRSKRHGHWTKPKNLRRLEVGATVYGGCG
ncbi:MAG TPA: hypothetical protein VF426_01505 [Marmoricola sp.]